jgi:transglutaminase-like putative cysteine protease
LSVHVEGEVDTDDTNGVIKGAIERFPPALFLRETSLTAPDAALRAFAAAAKADAKPDALSVLHALLTAVHSVMMFDTDPTHAATTAQESFAIKRGVCQDLTHIFICCARSLGIPARYVSGYFYRADGVIDQNAGHAWAEAYVDGLGWVAFDAANKISATDAHLRVAIGLDYLSAAPIRGTRYGGGDEALTVSVRVNQAMVQAQG